MNTTNLAALLAARKNPTPAPETQTVESVESVEQSASKSITQEPLSQHQIISSKISELQSQLLANHPQMPLLLREIHSTLKNNPAVVTLLSEDEIRVIVNGLQKQTNTYLVQSITSSKGSKTKALKNVSSADLGFD